jgi:lysophospholipase L1-like esterase
MGRIGIAILVGLLCLGDAMCLSKLPEWAVPKPWRKMRAPWGTWTDVNHRNARRLARLERAGPADFVLYGDSITAFHYGYTLSTRNRATSTYWKKHLGDVRAVPMAIAGDGIGNLVWRLRVGRELPRTPPRAVGVFIGINDVLRGENVTTIDQRMRYLVETVHAAFPTTCIVVCGLTPVGDYLVALARTAVNDAYRRIVSEYSARDVPIKYVDMLRPFTSANGMPTSPTILYDRVHLTGEGHDTALRALRSALNEFIN